MRLLLYVLSLEGTSQEPDIRKVYGFSGVECGVQIAIYIIFRKGEMVQQKVAGTQDIFQTMAALAEGNPWEVENG